MFGVFRADFFVGVHGISRHGFPLVFCSFIFDGFELVEGGDIDGSAGDECFLIDAVGTPLAIGHGLFPSNAHDRIERERRVREIVDLVWVVVRQVLSPNGVVWLCTLYDLRCGCTKDRLEPMEVFVPVEVRDFVLIHIERVDRNRSGRVIAWHSKEFILFSQRERTTLYRHHAGRVHVTDTFLCLEIGCGFIVIVPARSVGRFGVKFSFVAASSEHQNCGYQQQILNCFAHKYKVINREFGISGRKVTTFF